MRSHMSIDIAPEDVCQQASILSNRSSQPGPEISFPLDAATLFILPFHASFISYYFYRRFWR